MAFAVRAPVAPQEENNVMMAKDAKAVAGKAGAAMLSQQGSKRR